MTSVKANGKLIRKLREKLLDGKKASQQYIANLSADREALAKFKGETPPVWINEFGNGWLSNVETRSDDLFEENLLRSLAYILGVSFESITFSEYESPYKGLQAFSTKDARFFGGRDDEARAVFDRLGEYNLVGIIGASGSGKSSLAFAGVCPLITAERPGWTLLSFRIKAKPLESLFHALDAWLFAEEQLDLPARIARFVHQLNEDSDALYHYLEGKQQNTGQIPVLLIDQWEELYVHNDEIERAVFLRNIVSAIQKGAVKVLVTVRSDFYGELQSSEPPFFKLLKPNLIDLEPMALDQLRAAVEKPLEETGLQFERGLIDQLLEDVGMDQGQLPIMQFALSKLWLGRDLQLNRVTFETYSNLGGVRNVIKTHADEVIEKLEPTERKIAKYTLPALVNLGEFGNDVKLSVPLSQFSAEQREVLWKLSDRDSRLLTIYRSNDVTKPGTETDFVEIAHEELIRSWPSLRDWLNDDIEFHLQVSRMRASYTQYQESGFDSDLLIPEGKPIEDAKYLLQTHGRQGLGEISGYIKASIEKWKKIELEDQKRRKVRSYVISAAAIFAFAGMVTASYFYLQANRTSALLEEERVKLVDSNDSLEFRRQQAVEALSELEAKNTELENLNDQLETKNIELQSAIARIQNLDARNELRLSFEALSKFFSSLHTACSDVAASNEATVWAAMQRLSRNIAFEVNSFERNNDLQFRGDSCAPLLRLRDAADIWSAQPERATNQQHPEVRRFFLAFDMLASEVNLMRAMIEARVVVGVMPKSPDDLRSGLRWLCETSNIQNCR
ncbi:hypothetical protein [Aestuariivita sp.]|uniref:nSTAND1 domain-containing NTPase n=1 Tax=Aestuariivita sp. TaxID=1872407 RepID=UPI00216FB259|nr:hypothetical protein [Aestuariivita sp.]MCE8005973.1 hypothetical protein [Aestuariivita sp.]